MNLAPTVYWEFTDRQSPEELLQNLRQHVGDGSWSKCAFTGDVLGELTSHPYGQFVLVRRPRIAGESHGLPVIEGTFESHASGTLVRTRLRMQGNYAALVMSWSVMLLGIGLFVDQVLAKRPTWWMPVAMLAVAILLYLVAYVEFRRSIPETQSIFARCLASDLGDDSPLKTSVR